jgi:DNA-binding NarL/FixJ family response regulator
VLCDDSSSYRALLRTLIDATDGLTVVGEADDGAALLALLGRVTADVVLLDQRMPGRTGLELLPVLRTDHPDAAVHLVTSYGGEALSGLALERGASGCWLKGRDEPMLLQHLQQRAAA